MLINNDIDYVKLFISVIIYNNFLKNNFWNFFKFDDWKWFFFGNL